MNSDILYDPTFPHGTPEGFHRGCHGAHCPAAIPCRDVHRRYAGDFTFRRMFDHGMPLNVILERDQEAARAAVLAERAARRVNTRARRDPAPQKRSGGRTRRPFKTDGVPSTPLQHEIVKWHAQGLTDSEIAEKVGRSRDQVRSSRRWLNLPANSRPTMIDRVRDMHARGMTDEDMATELHANVGYIGMLRRRAKLPVNRNVRWNPVEFKTAHATGMTDRQLGEHFGIDLRTAAKRRRRLNLPINPSPGTAGAFSLKEGE